MFVSSKIGANPPEMEVWAFVSRTKVIWNQVLASKAKIF